MLYHLIGRCGNDGFNVGSRGEEFQWPDFWGDNKGLGSCNKHSKNIDDCHDNNCLYFQEAVTYKPGEDLPEIGKCRSLSTINWLSKQGYSQCKESYKDENGSEIGRTFNGEGRNDWFTTWTAAVDLAVSDYIEIYIYQNSSGGGSARDTRTSGSLIYTFFGGYRIGA